uniref:Uncharacterized protein n=1 Tax=Rhipicephalus zambeziensis TaxID=60191 RepID=A0A224YGU4_9ACAR
MQGYHSILQNKSCSLSPQIELHRHLLQDTQLFQSYHCMQCINQRSTDIGGNSRHHFITMLRCTITTTSEAVHIAITTHKWHGLDGITKMTHLTSDCCSMPFIRASCTCY